MSENNSMEGEEGLRVLMVGPTGAGKSSTANAIMMAAEGQEKKLYRTDFSSDSVTKKDEEYTRVVLGRKIAVVDTPGADNTKDDPCKILKEIRSAVENSKQPYDAILYVVNVFKTKLQLDDCTLTVFKLVDSVLGPEFWKHCVLIFTYGDEFKKRLEESTGGEYEVVSFDEFIRKDKVSLEKYAIGPHVELVQDAAVLLENRGDVNSKNAMVEDILKQVEAVKNRNSHGFGKEQLILDPVYPEPAKISKWKKAYDIVMPHLAQHWRNYVMFILMVVVVLLAVFGAENKRNR